MQLTAKLKRNLTKQNIRYFISHRLASLLAKLVLYVILIGLAYVFAYSLIFIVIKAFTPREFINDVTINWIPRRFTLDNLARAFKAMDFLPGLANSVLLAILPTIGHILSCSFVGYGFARCEFKGKNVLFMLAMLTLIVPTQSLIIPLFSQYYTYGWNGTILPLVVPAFFGMGLNSALYIFIFRQSFAGMPADLENAARIDGCGMFRTYLRVMLPLSSSAMLVCSILSIVWRWNDFLEPKVFITDTEAFTLPMRLPNIWNSYNDAFGDAVKEMNVAITMAACLLVIAPVILFYFVIQSKFMKSIETTGLVG